jgi:tetratricopeptide (TPR) repeat protein
MVALGQSPTIGRALGAGFTFESGPRAYTVAGSFCRYLLDTFGGSKLRALYRSAGDFISVYGRDLDALERDWKGFLAALPVDEKSRAEAEENFRRPAIFHKVCARELAARVSEARGLMMTAPADAVTLLSSTCADDPDEPTFHLDLAEAQIAAGDPDRALATLAETEASGSLTRPLRGRAANLRAGIHVRARRFAEAQAAIEQALRAATEDADERLARAKLRALADEPSRRTLGRVLFGDDRGRPLEAALAVYLLTEFARQFPDEELGAYLIGRQLAARDPKLALPYLADACPLIDSHLTFSMDAIFQKECRRLLAETAYLAGDLAAARWWFGWLSERADLEADRLRATDFLQRVQWKESAPRLPPSEGEY